MAISHSSVVKSILEAFEWRLDVYAWKNNTGTAKIGSRFVSFGHKGSADIIGFTSDGKFLGTEVKIGRDKQSKDQESFEEKVQIFGGRYVVVSDVLAAVKFLDDLKLPKLYAFEYFHKRKPGPIPS